MSISRILVGLMSGTSLDGISAAVVKFHEDTSAQVSAELMYFHERPYSAEERGRILSVIDAGDNDSICRLNFELGEMFAAAAMEAIQCASLGVESVTAIASHGQTIWHVPGVATLQIGEAAVIAEQTGLPVVSDFRVRDMAAGGQGAPLVPIADAMLFANDEWRLIQNIGGIGNVTVVPPGGRQQGVVAFDTGPGVVIIDRVVEMLTNGAERMDKDAVYSSAGRAVDAVVQEILELPFFATHPPRSTGRELFSAAFLERFIARCRALRPEATMQDIVATAVSLTARSIALAYSKFVSAPVTEVLLCGGGSRHPLLRSEIAREVAPMRVRDFGEVYFDSQAKEAVAFALLGLLHLRGMPGNVLGATGASGLRVLGKFTPA